LKTRSTRLKVIEREVENLGASPLYGFRIKSGYRSVPGAGDPHAHITFIGEAPGKQEALSGQPFVGAAGKFLNGLLHSIGLDRHQIFVTNILKDRPPANRPPRKREIEIYVPFLRRQIDIIRPAVIVTLGRFAMKFILTELDMAERGDKISKLHGHALRAKTFYGDVFVFPLFHPAVALYRRELKEVLKHDFEALGAYVDNDVSSLSARRRRAVDPPK